MSALDAPAPVSARFLDFEALGNFGLLFLHEYRLPGRRLT